LSSHSSIMSRTLLQVHVVLPWKASASIMLIGSKPTPKVLLYCFECNFNSDKQVDCHLLHEHHNWSKNKTLFRIWTISGGVPTWCVLAKYTCSKCNTKYGANNAHLVWVLDTNVSNSYPISPNYANGTFHFHKDRKGLMYSFMRIYGKGSWFDKQLF
jgi:hypothetical protein